jgi:hypothetical protein
LRLLFEIFRKCRRSIAPIRRRNILISSARTNESAGREFQTVYPGFGSFGGAHLAAFDHRHDPRNYFWRVVALPRAQSRIDGERVDPGINGTHRVRPDGSAVQKFDAPKATLISYIIKGILSHKLPWALVLLGAMTAVVLEMSGIPSLAFAVGVYLPLASSSPILIG